MGINIADLFLVKYKDQIRIAEVSKEGDAITLLYSGKTIQFDIDNLYVCELDTKYNDESANVLRILMCGLKNYEKNLKEGLKFLKNAVSDTIPIKCAYCALLKFEIISNNIQNQREMDM